MSTATPIQPAPTAPLPTRAATALARLELAFLPPHVADAASRYEIATARFDELQARPASELSPAEVDAYYAAQLTLSEAFCTLAEAKRLDLIEPAETAARYRWASVHCRRLVESEDFEGCAEAQDEMAMCRCQLANVGRLDLIGVA